MTWRVVDSVVREVAARIAAYPPERGGALLGPPGRPVVTRFLADDEAEVTSVTFRPSRSLNRRVRQAEMREGLEFKGLVHSHPGGLDRPSAQDALELQVGLRRNPHMGCYLAPIVTVVPGREGKLQPHELPCGEGRLSFHAGFRDAGVRARVATVEVEEVPMLRDLEKVREVFGGGEPTVFHTDLAGVIVPAGRILLDGDVEVLVLAHDLYPGMPPVILITPPGGSTEQAQVPWRIEAPAEDRLADALSSMFQPPGPYRLAWGPAAGPAMTLDRERARNAGWTARYTGADPDATARAAHEALFARSAGLLSRELVERTVFLAGVGSVGCYLAEGLVRSGLGRVILLDPEDVEPANLCRTGYDLSDVGRPKVEALARRLLQINPRLVVETQRRKLDDLNPEEIDGIVRRSDVLVGATDDPKAQRVLNQFAFHGEKPAVYVGLYEGAQGGEVILAVPGRTPCYQCATWARHGVEQATGSVGPAMDYGSGRLVGEVALGADIHHVASTAVKMILSLALPERSDAQLKGFVPRALDQGFSYLTFSMVPDYWFYPSLLGQVPGQFAWQSVALTPVGQPDCPVCGEAGARVDPLAVPVRPPTRDAFRDLVQADGDAPSAPDPPAVGAG